jgi:tRNA A37 threonylcarbamoyladenosine dehydratase
MEDISVQEHQYISGMLNRTLLFYDDVSVEKIRNTTIAISGLGGVGAITAELLARWGVKKFRLLDMDRYDLSNMNRQIFATSKTLGKYKADIAAERIREINPYADIEEVICERVDNVNVHRFVKGAGMIIQNADHPSCKLIYEAARQYHVPLVNGYASVTGGFIQSFDYRKSSCKSILNIWWDRLKYGRNHSLEHMDADTIACFDKENVHSTAPSLNYVTNMVGCIIVSEAVKLLTGYGKAVKYPYYLAFDTADFRFRIKHIFSLLELENYKKILNLIKQRRPR